MTDYPSDPADVLEQAADLLETQGWCQGEFDDGAGRHCAVGAIRRVTGMFTLSHSLHENKALVRKQFRQSVQRSQVAVDILAEKLSQTGWRSPESFIYIPSWNDESGRTASEVIDLMKHTAKDLRNRKEPA